MAGLWPRTVDAAGGFGAAGRDHPSSRRGLQSVAPKLPQLPIRGIVQIEISQLARDLAKECAQLNSDLRASSMQERSDKKKKKSLSIPEAYQRIKARAHMRRKVRSAWPGAEVAHRPLGGRRRVN